MLGNESDPPVHVLSRGNDDTAFLLEELVATSPLEAGEAAVRADAAPLVVLGMLQAGVTVADIARGFEMAGVEVRSRRARRAWLRSLGRSMTSSVVVVEG